jgi:hypothetical protein
MLVLFGFSTTPKLVLHNLLANHKDTPVNSSTSRNAELTASGFHCDVENLVVESPFLFENINLNFDIKLVFATYQNKPTHNFYSTENLVSCPRGPPSIA